MRVETEVADALVDIAKAGCILEESPAAFGNISLQMKPGRPPLRRQRISEALSKMPTKPNKSSRKHPKKSKGHSEGREN